MPTIRATLGATLLASLAASAHAGAHWLCNVSHDGTQLICIADEPADRAATPSPPATTAQVRGTRFPLDPARRYTVEMWSPPTEADFVALLARATICYRSPGCEVTLAPGPWLAAAVSRQAGTALADAIRPAP
jgi:hypothetical protein